jgi:hypothetical protein
MRTVIPLTKAKFHRCVLCVGFRLAQFFDNFHSHDLVWLLFTCFIILWRRHIRAQSWKPFSVQTSLFPFQCFWPSTSSRAGTTLTHMGSRYSFVRTKSVFSPQWTPPPSPSPSQPEWTGVKCFTLNRRDGLSAVEWLELSLKGLIFTVDS